MDEKEVIKKLTELKEKWEGSANTMQRIANGLYPRSNRDGSRPSGYGPLSYAAQREYLCAKDLDKIIKELS